MIAADSAAYDDSGARHGSICKLHALATARCVLFQRGHVGVSICTVQRALREPSLRPFFRSRRAFLPEALLTTVPHAITAWSDAIPSVTLDGYAVPIRRTD